MIKIEITNAEIKNVSGTSQKTGKPYSFNKQEAWAHLPGQRYPTQIDITLDDGDTGYPLGNYQILPESLYVNQFNKLALGSLKLKSIDTK